MVILQMVWGEAEIYIEQKKPQENSTCIYLHHHPLRTFIEGASWAVASTGHETAEVLMDFSTISLVKRDIWTQNMLLLVTTEVKKVMMVPCFSLGFDFWRIFTLDSTLC